MHVDLHIHTTASDGCWTPDEVVRHVQAAGIDLFAIADHDTMVNVAPSAELARRAGLAFLPATEVSALLDGQLVHLLAYGVRADDTALDQLLAENGRLLNAYNEVTLHRLAEAGHPINLDAYAAYRHDPSRGGWRALSFLIDSGLCQDVDDFFRHLFVGAARAPWPSFPHPARVIAAIREADGVPVLAHPGSTLREQGVRAETLAPFVAMGVAGLECYSTYHDQRITRTCLDFCARHDLLVTGGSDCHGGFAGRQLGVPRVQLDDLRLGPIEGRILQPV